MHKKAVQRLLNEEGGFEQIVITRISCIAAVGDRCGEGVVWDEGASSVYWTDINRFLIHRLDVASGITSEWHFGEPVVALSLTTDAKTLLVALGSRLLLWRPSTDDRLDQGFRLDGWPSVRLNDGRTDPHGNFWVGSMRNNVNADGSVGQAGGTDGRLYRVTARGDVSVWREQIGISNTLCWSPDQKKFYFGDTLANTIYCYEFDSERGEVANPKSFFTSFDRGLPDGSAVDSQGFLWNCRYGGGCIVRIAPDGSVDRVIEMPILNPTTCTFGGKDLRTLFVTSAGISSEYDDGSAGGLFEVATEVKGLQERRFILQ